MSLTTRTACQLLDLLHRGEVGAQALTRQFLDAIQSREPSIRAFLHLDEAGALAQAEAVDRKRAAGQPLGPLAGLPVALKDNLCVKGQPTTAGSKILANYRPPYDAHVVERLRAADAVLIGKTNLDEFAMGSSTENSAFGPTHNPLALDRTPGGSSGGSAAAVASGGVPLALGSDTGGSVRQPASYCGIVGLKPSYGRVSRYGLIAFGSSLDQIGTLTRDVADAALLLEVIAGHDRRDSTSVDRPVPHYRQRLDEPLRNLTIGVPREYFGEGLDKEVEAAVRRALQVYQERGATLREVSLPHSQYALAVYYLVAPAEASSNLARYDGVHFGHRTAEKTGLIDLMARSRDEGLGAEVKRRILLGTYALSSGYRDAYYVKALQVRRLIRGDFDAALAQCDVIAGPTAPTVAFHLGEKLSDPLAMYLADVYTINANLTGLPGISVPCGTNAEGLPIGLQLVAGAFEEEKLLRVARMHERAAG